jgi:hypothetical protein
MATVTRLRRQQLLGAALLALPAGEAAVEFAHALAACGLMKSIDVLRDEQKLRRR